MNPDWDSIAAAGWRQPEEQIIGFFRELASQYPTSARAKFELANAYDYFGREAEAIPLYEDAVQIGLKADREVLALIQLGSSLRNVGRLSEAVRVLAGAERRFPDVPTASMFLALALFSEGRGADALAVVMKAMLRHVETADINGYRRALENYIRELAQQQGR